MDASGSLSQGRIKEEVMQCFWDLASVDSSVRIQATAKLIKNLKEFQDTQDAKIIGEPSSWKPPLRDVLRGASPLVAYSVDRLCKGLSSGRKSARQGFSLALTAVLRKLPCFGVESIPALLEVFAELASGGGPQEVLGQLFGLGIIVRAFTYDVETAISLLDQAVSLATKKSFLREAAAQIMFEILDTKLTNVHVFNPGEELHKWLSMPHQQTCPEAIAVALRFWCHIPQELWKTCPLLPSCRVAPSGSLFRKGRRADDANDGIVAASVLTRAHLQKYVPALRLLPQPQGRFHLAWSCLLCLLLPGAGVNDCEAVEEPHKAGTDAKTERVVVEAPLLEAFWEVLLEGDIFASSSLDRQYIGFLLSNKLLQNIETKCAVSLLTPNFLHCLAQNCSIPRGVLHATANYTLQSLTAVLANSSSAERLVMLAAITKHERGLLSKLYLNQATEHILQEDQAATTRDRAQQLQGEFLKLRQSQAGATNLTQLRWALDQLAMMMKTDMKMESGALEILFFLVDQGLFKPTSETGMGTSPDDYEVRAHALGLCISNLAALTKASRPKTSPPGEPTQHDILLRILKHVNENLQSGAEFAQPSTPASQEARDGLNRVRHALTNLLASSKTASSVKCLHETIRLVCLLELYAIAQPNSADPAIVSVLESVGKEWLAHGELKAVDPLAEQEHWSENLVDVVLTVLARDYAPLPAALLRDTAERLFAAISSFLTASGIHRLLQVVVRQPDLAEGDADDSGEDEMSMEEDDGDEDKQSDSHDEDDGKDDDESEGNPQDIGSDDDQEGEDGIDGNTDDDMDGNMDDEQMVRLDSQLAAYFATLRTGRDGKKIRQELFTFKMRVLACIETFMQKAGSSSLVVLLPESLLTALSRERRVTGNQALADRLAGLLKNSLLRCKVEIHDEAWAEMLQGQLRKALYLASRSDDKIVQDAASSAFVFLQRAAQGHEECSVIAKQSLHVALEDFFSKKKTRLVRRFFQDLFQRVPGTGLAVLPALLEKCCGGARNDFLRLEAYLLVEAAIKLLELESLQRLSNLANDINDMFVEAISDESKRRGEGLKAVCGIVQTLDSRNAGLKTLLGTKRVGKMLAAINAAINVNPNDARLARLKALVESPTDNKPSGKRRGGEPIVPPKKEKKTK